MRHRRRGVGRGGGLRGDRRGRRGFGHEDEGAVGHRVGAQSDEEAHRQGAEDLEVAEVPGVGRCPWVDGMLAHGGNQVHQGISEDTPPTLRGRLGRQPRGRHSARRSRDVRVRAAIRPGITETRLANTTALECDGRDGGDRHRRMRHGRDAAGEQDPQPPPQGDPDRDAGQHPDQGGHRGLPRHRRRDSSLGEPERLEEGELSAALADGRHQREAQRPDGADGEDAGQEGGRRADRPVLAISAGRSAPTTPPTGPSEDPLSTAVMWSSERRAAAWLVPGATVINTAMGPATGLPC